MVVLKGSTIAEFETDSMPEHYRELRRRLIEWGIIVRMDGHLTFAQDYQFGSASEAVCIVEGGSRSGFQSWKDGEGRMIAELGYSR